MKPEEIKPKFDQIVISVVREIYQTINSETSSISTILEFDPQQRAKAINNLVVDGAVKMPSFELTEKINKLTTEITSFPEDYWIKSLDIKINPGGKMSLGIGYLKDRN